MINFLCTCTGLLVQWSMDAMRDAEARMAAMCRRISNFSSAGLAPSSLLPSYKRICLRAALQVQAIRSQGIS